MSISLDGSDAPIVLRPTKVEQSSSQVIVRKRKAARSGKPSHLREEVTTHKFRNSILVTAAAIGILGLALYLLLPTLANGYNGDDARNSEIPNIMSSQHQSFWQLVGENIRAWAKAAGRFFPLSIIETAAVFLTFGTRWSYKVFQMGIVIADVVLLAATVGRITRKASVGLLAAFIAVLTFQMRQFFDPILLFSGQQQFVVGFVLIALWSLWSALESGRKLPTVIACLAWSAAMLTYETTYLLLPLFVAVALFNGKNKRSRLVNSAVFTIPAVALLAIVMVLRHGANVKSPSYMANFDIGPVASTFAKQTTSAIPLSYPLWGSHFPTTWSTGPIVTALILGLVAIGVLIFTLRHVSLQRRQAAFLLMFGLGMWALPSLVVAITKGWQNQVQWGAGYVSEYVGYFGFAMTATVVIVGLAQIRRIIPTAVSISVASTLGLGSGFLLSVTNQNNVKTIASWDNFRYPRDTFERSVQHGVFTGVLPNSSVISLHPGVWVDTAVIQGHDGPAIRKIDPPYTNQSLPNCPSLGLECFATVAGPNWMTNHTGTKDGNGVSVVARITSALPSPDNRPKLFSNDIYAYVESPKLRSGIANGTIETVRETRSGTEPLLLSTSQATLIGNDTRGDDGWALWHFSGIPQVSVDRVTVKVDNSLAGALSPF